MATHPTRSDIDLLSGEFWGRDPQEEMAWMRAQAPVYFDAPNAVWGIATHTDVKAISGDSATFSSAEGIRPGVGPVPMMIDMDDPAHVRRRKLVNRGFTPRRVRDQEGTIRRVCDEIIDSVCERGECDFVTELAAPLPMVMIGDALGVAPEDRRQLLQWSDDMLCGLTGNVDGIEAATEAFVGYHAYADRAIEERRADPKDDLMSVLVHAEVDGDRLDNESIVHESLLILIGGDETTRHVLSGGAYQLLVDRSRWEALRADPGRLATAVEEMLRWVSPIRNMARTATRDVVLRGKQIEKGQELMLLYPSANRDESVFADPFTFDIDRHPNEHLAFGFGAHFCLGNSLARLELRVMFEQLLTRLPDLELVDPHSEPGHRHANFVSGYESLPVRFTPSAPTSSAQR